MRVSRSVHPVRPLPLLAGAAALFLLAAGNASARDTAPEPPSPALKRATELYSRFRVTLDHADLEAAEYEIEKGLSSAPADFTLRKFRLRILLAHHEFEDLEVEARALQRERPDDPELDGALGDAYFDLGRTAEAVAAYERFASVSHSAGAWSRIALVRERMGDLVGALTAMDLAAGAARTSDPEAFAWCRSRSARLLLKLNRYDEAEGRLVDALHAVPSHAPSLATAAEIAARKGLWEAATRLAETSLGISPDLSVAAALVEYRRAMRDAAGEDRARRLVAELEPCLPEDHKLVHRFLALYLADGPDPARAVDMTARELATRQDPGGYEAWAWALYRAGRAHEAVSPVRTALASGGPDPLLEFRAGAIFLAAGDPAAARAHLGRALAMDPRFHVLYADEARRMLTGAAPEAASLRGAHPTTLPRQ
jgi:tetratricopeptide (TPR) repeat protein